MSDKAPLEKRSAADQFLDTLLDALDERQAARQRKLPRSGFHAARDESLPPDQALGSRSRAAAPQPALIRAGALGRTNLSPQAQPTVVPGAEGTALPSRQPSIQLDCSLWRLMAVVATLLVLVNVPLNRQGVSLARMLPDSASLIIRDGLILKGSGPEIYVLGDGRLRWISSMDAFEHLGFNWRDVHLVDDGLLARFEQGPPIHVLLKCEGSPHIYRVENQRKRWIKNIDSFLAEGHVWRDVHFVSCDCLRSMADGPPIPEDAGPPPQP